MTDNADPLWGLPADQTEFIRLASCAGCLLRGADSTHVYATTLAPRGARHPVDRGHDDALTYTDLLAYEITGESARLVGRHRIPPLYDNLLVGPGRVVALTETIVALRPAPAR